MLEALAVTVNALAAAAELDVDRTDDDRAFFAAEQAALVANTNAIEAAEASLIKHQRSVLGAKQARVVIGDKVLDRGVRAGKQRMRLELKNIEPEAADHVFPTDIEEIVSAEMRVEPQLVLAVTAKFSQVPDFSGKDALKSDLEGRANRQTKNFTDRTDAEVGESKLWGALDRAVAEGSDALYRLEKRMFDRFPREKTYVRAFFLDVAPDRKKKGAEKPAGGVESAGGDAGSKTATEPAKG